jgi:hypothetical protein
MVREAQQIDNALADRKDAQLRREQNPEIGFEDREPCLRRISHGMD